MHALRLAIIFILVLPSLVWADTLVVMQSNYTDLAAGSRVSADKEIRLVSGQILTLINASGKEIRIEGPYNGKIDSVTVQTDDDSWLNDIVSLLQNKKKKKTATFRSFEQERGNLATNLIDIESQGNICIDADKPIGLWRRDDIETLEVHFGIVAGTDIDLYWSADEQTIPWPRLLKQQTEQAYRIRMAGKGTEHQFKLHYFPPSFDSPYHQIAWMNQQHCETQALELLQTHQQP